MENTLKLYSYDAGWAGGIVVVAKSKEDAMRIITTETYYGKYIESFNSLTEIELKEGSVIEFLGDQ